MREPQHSISPLDAKNHSSVDQLIRRAFETAAQPAAQVLEAPLVEQLRVDGDMLFERVLVDSAGLIQGHVAVSRVWVSGTPVLSAGQLAPVSVHPLAQGQGIGKQLIRSAIHTARLQRLDVLFVLGNPDYYNALGFEYCEIKSAYGPSAFYRACFLQGGSMDLSQAEVMLAPAFMALD
ncbi:MAG: GNAT family N-acetyltransferase [Pseudomonadales bacterium]